MSRRQFRVLYRDFLFSIVDRELLSTHAKGDASQLLLQLVALLVFLSMCVTVPVLSVDSAWPAQLRLMFAWSVEHFLIATTMLAVGIFAVLSWDSMFPSRRDVLVLGPLPIHAHTILLARLAAMATALTLSVVALHVVAGVLWPLALGGIARERPIHALALTYDEAIPPVSAAGLQGVLDRDLAEAIRSGPLAPHAGGALSIGIYQRGVRRTFAYGAAATDSIFHIASVTKPLTGLLLAAMAEEGSVRLDEPVRELIPSAGLPRPAGNEITLLDLATHRSGLPPMPANFRPADRANPYADFDVAELYAFLRRRGLEKPPGTAPLYSNLGYGLLGHALSRRARVDYATLVRQRITAPLALDDTVVELSPEQRSRLMQGQNDDGQPIPPWDVAELAGAGALYSTAPDMLAWLEANLHPETILPPTLSAAFAVSQQMRVTAGPNGGLALAWTIRRDSGVLAHGGATAGFTADAFFNPKEDLAAIVLSNVGPGTAVSADVLGEHLRARLDGTQAVSLTEVIVPATGGIRAWIGRMTAYWLTMMAAAVFTFGFVMSVQGLAASLLPRRHFLRVSSLLQLGTFCLVIGVYFLQPMLVRPAVILAAQDGGMLASSPTYWFLGLFQTLSGSPALAPLAHHAWLGLALAVFGTAIAYALSYARAIRQIAEQPDISPVVSGLRWLPPFGTTIQTAVVQFSIRTLFRSAQHRVILAFYWGLGFALTIIFLKSPTGQQLADVSIASAWHETSVPLLLSSVVTMAFAVVAARLAFAMPRDLAANWIFRVVPGRSGTQYMSARRRALLAVAVAPVCVGWAIVLLWMWPWQPALGHLLALALLGMVLVEISLNGALKIPFTCSYLPGKSHVHLAFYAAVVILFPLTIKAATAERDALQNPNQYALVLGILGTTWLIARSRTSSLANAVTQLEFDDEPADRIVSLGLEMRA